MSLSTDSADHPLSSGAAFQAGLHNGFPIALGYLPVGVTFGLLANQQGFSLIEATLASLLIFSGAAQFMMIALLEVGTGWLGVALLCLLLNVRHVLYGPAIAARIPAQGIRLAILSHGLTDEVFAVALARLEQQPESARVWWLGGVECAAWSAWVGSTVVGALTGHWITDRLPALAQALPFALAGLFLVLLMPYVTRERAVGLALTLILASGLSLAGYPAAAILAASVIGALACSRRMPWISR